MSVERDQSFKVESDYPLFDASEPHDLLQEPHGSFVDLVADSYGADGGSSLDDFGSLFQYDEPDYVTTNSTTSGGQEDFLGVSPFDLDNTFLTHDLALSSAPGLSDTSAIFSCDGS